MSYTNQLLENLKNGKHTNLLYRIFGGVIDIYSSFLWDVPLKHKKVIAITNAFQKVLDEWGRKSSKIWVDKDKVVNFAIDQWNQSSRIII